MNIPLVLLPSQVFFLCRTGRSFEIFIIWYGKNQKNTFKISEFHQKHS